MLRFLALQRSFCGSGALPTEWYPGRDGPAVNPEGHPGQHDHESSRKVSLQQEEEDVPPQGEVNVQTIVPA